MPRFSLRYQLTGWFLLIGVVPVMAGGLYSYSMTRAGLFREAAALMRGDADGAADRFVESVEIVRAELAFAASQVANRVLESKPKSVPRRPSNTPPTPNLEAATGLLAAWGSGAPVPLDAWAVVGTEADLRVLVVRGEPAVGSLSDGARELALAAQTALPGDVVFGGVLPAGQAGRPVLVFATPVIGADGAALGSLLGEVPVEWFQRSIEGPSAAGGSLWVLDDAGHAVLTTDTRFEANEAASRFRGNLEPDESGLARVELGSSPHVVVAVPLAVAAQRPPWRVIVSAPEHLIAAKANAFRYASFLAAAVVVVVLAAAVVGARIARPIRTLEEGTRRIAHGDLDFQLPVRGRGELDQLAGSFHQMAYELKRTQERLIKTERMAAIANASLALPHELNAPLGSVVNAAESLRTRHDLPDEVREQILSLRQSALHMRDIVRKLDHVSDRTTDAALGGRAMGVDSSRTPANKGEDLA